MAESNISDLLYKNFLKSIPNSEINIINVDMNIKEKNEFFEFLDFFSFEFFITLPELKEIQIDYEKYKDSISTILYHFILYKTGDIYDYIMYNLLDFEEDEEDEEDEEE
jgi:hypothetical protein